MNELSVSNSVVSSIPSLVEEPSNQVAGQAVGKSSEPPIQAKTENSKEEITKASLDNAVENINSFVQSVQRDLSFSVDKESGAEVISVFDKNTNELIRQIPSEEALELMQNLDRITGLLFDSNV